MAEPEYEFGAIRGCMIALITSIIIWLALAFIVSQVARAAPSDHWLCRVVENGSISLSGRIAEWVGYPEGWKDMPSDLYDIPIDVLYTDEDMKSGYMLQFSPSAQELWIFPLWDFEVGTDSNGNYSGTHHLCAVRVYDLNPEHRK